MAKIVDPEETVKEAVEEEAPEKETPEVNESTENEWDTRKMDPEEELWEGGPNVGQLNAWKDQHGRVFISEFMGEFYIYRTLTRAEYRRLVNNLEQAVAAGKTQGSANMDNEDAIAEMCILYPEYSRVQSATKMAGIATSISQQVMDVSGFVPTDVREL